MITGIIQRERSCLISGLILLFLGIPFCLFFGPICALVGGQVLAFGDVPQYPSVKLISTDRTLHSNTVSETQIYKTDDNLDTVLAYMEQHLPGFVKLDQPPSSRQLTNTIYRNSLRPSWVADLAIRYADFMRIVPYTEGLPSKVVLIYSDPDNPGGTVIEVINDWWSG